MKNLYQNWMGMCFSSIILILFTCGLAGAEEIAVVDVEKLENESNFISAQIDELQKFISEKKMAVQNLVAMLLVDKLFSSEELETYRTLMVKEELTDEEEQQLQALEGLSAARQEELNNLNLKPSEELTEEDKQRLSELQNLSNEMLGRRIEEEQLRMKFSEEIQEETKAVMERLNEAVLGAIASVAEEKDIGLVLRISENILYLAEDMDITSQVISILDEEVTETASEEEEL